MTNFVRLRLENHKLICAKLYFFASGKESFKIKLREYRGLFFLFRDREREKDLNPLSLLCGG